MKSEKKSRPAKRLIFTRDDAECRRRSSSVDFIRRRRRRDEEIDDFGWRVFGVKGFNFLAPIAGVRSTGYDVQDNRRGAALYRVGELTGREDLHESKIQV